MDLLSLMKDKVFLAQEFLTWLWFCAEIEPAITLTDGRQVEITLGDRLSLGPALGQEGTRVSVTGREASLAEARQAIKRGKLVEAIRLELMVDGDEYKLNLAAAELAITGLKTPAIAPAEGGPEGLEGLILERIALIDGAVRVLDSLFLRFIGERLGWQPAAGLRPQMLAWAAGGQPE